jgi:hypothetical protein
LLILGFVVIVVALARGHSRRAEQEGELRQAAHEWMEQQRRQRGE